VRNWVALALPVVLLVPLSCTGGDPSGPALAGAELEVLAVWDDAEAERFRLVLDRFEEAHGARVRYTSTEGADVGTVLDARLASGTAPAVAVVPLPGLIRRYARQGHLVPLEEVVGDAVDERYADVWRELGTVDGELFGLWFKAAHKSLVWYAIDVFERAGLVPAEDLDQLGSLADALTATGQPAFAVGADDGWTLTDWFENLYLRVAGPQRYEELAEGRLSWSHPSVVETLEAMASLLAPANLPGGPGEALQTTFAESVAQVSQRPPAAAMLVGGDFVAGFVEASGDAELGVDVDVAFFPEPDRSARAVVGAGDAVVVFREEPASLELVRFLATAEAGETWARMGGFLSPNEEVALDAYPDERTRRIARGLLDAGDDFRFDLSDRQPAEFGGTAGAGMLGILQAFLLDPRDPAATAGALEAAAVPPAGP
jgi:alpha-glucoside transport system substrate-binding protein